MDERKKKLKAAIFLIIPVVVIVIFAIFAKQIMPNKERKDLKDYYKVEDKEILLVMQDEISESRGLYIDNTAYIDYDTVKTVFDKRFYFDANENLLIYTNPSEVIKADVGSKDYYMKKSKTSVDYQIVKVMDEKAYIAVDYIELLSNVKADFYDAPNRLVFTYKWDGKYETSVVKKKTPLREAPDKKSAILYDLKEDDEIVYIKETKEESSKNFAKVITKDGVIGFALKSHLKAATPLLLVSDYEEPEYTSITKDEMINLVWHQVTNREANDYLLNLLDATKGVTTISPTWFSIANNDGDITSLASETYVKRAHGAGVEVWALCDDFDTKNVSTYELLSRTSKREKLENSLIAEAIKYNLDGINIDFENIGAKTAEHFIQFIRELAIKCRSNEIVLSIDNYAPGYTGYYDREEQGIVADYVITMAYDEFYGGSEVSGPVASIGYVKDAITNTLKEVPAEKMIIGVPFYSRLWKEVKAEDDQLKVTSEAYGMTRGANVLKDHGVTLIWDEATGYNYGEFEADGAKYRMWLEDAQSIELKLKAISEAKVAGIAGWKLNLESPNIWDVIIKYIN